MAMIHFSLEQCTAIPTTFTTIYKFLETILAIRYTTVHANLVSSRWDRPLVHDAFQAYRKRSGIGNNFPFRNEDSWEHRKFNIIYLSETCRRMRYLHAFLSRKFLAYQSYNRQASDARNHAHEEDDRIILCGKCHISLA
jgi:hypothetical protein